MAGEPVARRRYYTPAEVSEHNAPQDCWVSILGEVFDITQLVKVTACLINSTFPLSEASVSLIQAQQGSAAAPLIAAAGTDISHW